MIFIDQEIRKIRPAIIVSNNANNRVSEIVTVIPITFNVTKVYPFEVFIAANESGLPKPQFGITVHKTLNLFCPTIAIGSITH
ncbi:type II toxin-antitoxin system PemK/MazF family toxin, partial [Cysteiniphilum halobium]|uniref:type II toxin-antitoxin system PemK/MazF family toxin n=1 Tax=Cysteiniphilum halobium TaxID=2219059 RepID=UPI003F84390B